MHISYYSRQTTFEVGRVREASQDFTGRVLNCINLGKGLSATSLNYPETSQGMVETATRALTALLDVRNQNPQTPRDLSESLHKTPAGRSRLLASFNIKSRIAACYQQVITRSSYAAPTSIPHPMALCAVRTSAFSCTRDVEPTDDTLTDTVGDFPGCADCWRSGGLAYTNRRAIGARKQYT